jgi:hypothetical protein
MRRSLTAAVVAFLAVACAGQAAVSPSAPAATSGASTRTSSAEPTSSAQPTATRDVRDQSWRDDIAQLTDKIERLHPDLDRQIAAADLETAASDLSERVTSLTDDQVLVGIMRIVALVSRKGCDAHTGAFVWGSGTYSVDSLPLRLWLFGDDVYVVDALPPYRSLVGKSISAIGGTPIANVLDLVEPIVPRDNDQTVRLLMPRFLLIPQILRGVGVAAGPTVTVQTSDESGATVDTDVAPVAMSAYNDWAGAYGLHLPADPEVLYLSRMDDVLWWQRLPDEALYVQYNEMQSADFADLQSAIDEPDVHSVVLDLRHNFGGEIYVVDRLSSMLDAWLAGPHHELEVATGRNTFSAASILTARLASDAHVSVSGEPMGGCPTGWGDSTEFWLPNSGIQVSVSTTFEVGASATDGRATIVPDIPAELTFQDWQAKLDPVLAPHLVGGQ